MMSVSLAKMMLRVSVAMVRRLRLGRYCRSFRSRAAAAGAVVVLNVVFIVCLYRGGNSRRQLTPGDPPRSPDFAAAATPFRGGDTPLLDRLDALPVIRADVSASAAAAAASGRLERCEGWTAGVPDIDMEEPQRWQAVVDGVSDTFVFSAFFDHRSTLSYKCRQFIYLI